MVIAMRLLYRELSGCHPPPHSKSFANRPFEDYCPFEKGRRISYMGSIEDSEEVFH